jgi:hypothetical protein
MVIAKLLNRGEHTFRVMDIENSETLRFVVILNPKLIWIRFRNRCGVSFNSNLI